MMRTVPFRFNTLQLRQIFFTEARTFMIYALFLFTRQSSGII